MIVGGSSPQRWKMDKLSMRLKFQAKYGPTKLRYPVFGDDATDELDTLVGRRPHEQQLGLRRRGRGQSAGSRPTRPGAVYPRPVRRGPSERRRRICPERGRHVHLYLNGLYWGLYWLHERPDEHFAAAYFGGDAEDYDVLKHNSSQVVNGSSSDYRQMLTLAAAGQYDAIQQHLDIPRFHRLPAGELLRRQHGLGPPELVRLAQPGRSCEPVALP